MLLENVDQLYHYYVLGGKKVSVRTTYMRIVSKPQPSAEFTKSSPNVDLFFDEQGLLKECFDHSKGQRITFNYTEDKRLSELLIFGKSGKYIVESTRFEYDDQGRIISEWVDERNGEEDENPPEVVYDYQGKMVTMTILPDKYCKDEGTFISIYNDFDQLIEQKGIRNEDELIMWDKFEYNLKGQKVKEISLDEKGLPEGFTEYFYNEKGLEISFKNFDKEGVYTGFYNDRLYQYNERGDWINHVLTDEFGAPKIIYDREIEYY
jgi:hypothetical protein